MEEEFQGGVCGGNLWNSSRNLFGLSPCSSSINDLGSFGWFNHGVIVDMKTAKSISEDNSAGSASDGGGGSIVLQDVQKPQQPNSNGNMSVASTLQMMGISPSPSTTTDDWNQDLIQDSGRSQQNYSHMLQPTDSLNSSINNCREKIAGEWTTNNFSANSSNIDSFKQVNQSFPLMQQHSNSFTNLPSYSYTSSLLQTLFDADSANYSSSPNYRMNSADSSLVKPNYLPKQQPTNNNFQFVNNAPFWNATSAATTDDFRASFLPSTQPQLIPSSLSRAKLNPRNVTAKHHNGKAAGTVSVAKKVRNEPAFKHPRIETPSPLPTFKVQKEKLGDRVTALQQLVSPFGKTDTASVLHEAIEYIKLLHDQVTVLSTPYLKNRSPPLPRQQASDQEEPIKDLKSRGLCLVPISSTFPVAAETTADFWTPTFGGSFR